MDIPEKVKSLLETQMERVFQNTKMDTIPRFLQSLIATSDLSLSAIYQQSSSICRVYVWTIAGLEQVQIEMHILNNY